MLVERLTIDAVGKALHHQRPLVDDRQDQRRDARVVADQIALGELRPRPEDLLQIGDVERVAVRKLKPPILLRCSRSSSCAVSDSACGAHALSGLRALDAFVERLVGSLPFVFGFVTLPVLGPVFGPDLRDDRPL